MSSRFACLALTCVFVLAACPAPRVNQGTPQFTVEVTVTHATATPAGTVKVNASATQAFTVVPAEGYTLSKTVGGTCPAGTWAGTVYTTGAVTADCTVSFSGTQNTYQVTPSGTNVTLDPSGVQTVGYGLTQSFTVTAAIGYTVSTTVGGTCPAGTWAGAVYTTGPVTANCTVIFDGTLEMLQVTPSGANVTIAPSGVQTVGYGSTPSFTVTPAADDTLTTTVGGTCPAGTWAGAVYTTGPITASCTVIFGATLDSYVVTPSGTNATFSPTGPQTVAAGSTASFSLTPASNDILSSTAGGTCPAGSWSGTTYTTGAITASCTVTFTAGPIVLNPGTSQMLSVSWGQTTPTIAYSATANGVPLSVTWSLDRTDVASIAGGPSTGAAFTPTGASGGLVTLTASAGGATASAQILVTLVILQNGANTNPAEQAQIPANQAALKAGGGVGGVGGEGLGPAVGDGPTLTALGSPVSNGQAQGLAYLYPYDQTVWPLGLQAPLLMWTWQTMDADAVEIQMTDTEHSFAYTGTFARPAILTQTTGPFIRCPIPQDFWALLTSLAAHPLPGGGADLMTVSLTVAKGGIGYGPISETWTIASGALPGIIYYGTYGVGLAENASMAVGGNGLFGGVIASLVPGASNTKLAAGTNAGAESQADCRGCHSVSPDGSMMTASHGDNYQQASAYALTSTGSTEYTMTHMAQYPAVTPKGSAAMSEISQLMPLPVDTTLTNTTGLSATDLGTPEFSADGTKLVFNPLAGTPKTYQSLYVASFDILTATFGTPVLVVDDSALPMETRPGWGAFLPDNQSIVFQQQSSNGTDGSTGGQLYTRGGSKAQIAWTQANTTTPATITPLSQLNGQGYLPKAAAASTLACTSDSFVMNTYSPDHDDDVDVNYEPFPSPVSTGGYTWLAFTSRRMYGNEITTPPFCSDPRGADLVENISPKKIWVSAINLNPTAGTDPSHPAFYLPAQLLLGSNGRATWSRAPCLTNGSSCATGDQCCGGYCEAGTGTGTGLVCASTPPSTNCSAVQDACATAADCCDSSDACLDGFCAAASAG